MRRWFIFFFVKYKNLHNKERKLQRKIVKNWNSMQKDYGEYKNAILQREEYVARVRSSIDSIECRSEVFVEKIPFWPLKHETVAPPNKDIWAVCNTILSKKHKPINDAKTSFMKAHAGKVKALNQDGVEVSLDEPVAHVPKPKDQTSDIKRSGNGQHQQGKGKGGNNQGNNNSRRGYHEPAD